jgi:putative tricarboxylic transport membrane protein
MSAPGPGSGPGSGPGTGPDKAGLVIAAALAALAIVIFWQTRIMPAGGMQSRVGPTTLPYGIAAGLALLSVGTLVSALRGGFPARDADRPGPMLWIVAGLVLQLLLLKPAGFAIATGLLFAFTARGFGRGPLWMTIPLGIAVCFVIWLIFAGLLQLSLPAGPLERLVF